MVDVVYHKRRPAEWEKARGDLYDFVLVGPSRPIPTAQVPSWSYAPTFAWTTPQHAVPLGQHYEDLTTVTGVQMNELCRLTLATVTVPVMSHDFESEGQRAYDEYAKHSKITARKRIDYAGVADTISSMPQAPNIVLVSGVVRGFVLSPRPLLVYDFEKHSASNRPIHSLSGSAGVTSCSEWSPYKAGTCASGDANGNVCFWNILSGNPSLYKVSQSVGKGRVASVRWNRHEDGLFAVVCDDSLSMWDLNAPPRNGAVTKLPAVTSASWSRKASTTLATGGSDGSVNVWDTRFTNRPVFTSRTSSKPVTHVAMNNGLESATVVASATAGDGLVYVWDATKTQSPPVFVHAAHSDAITDIEWDPVRPWVIGSLSKESFSVWQMAENLRMNW